MKITLYDERVKDSEKRERVFHYEGGISDYVKYLNAEKQPLHEKPVYLGRAGART